MEEEAKDEEGRDVKEQSLIEFSHRLRFSVHGVFTEMRRTAGIRDRMLTDHILYHLAQKGRSAGKLTAEVRRGILIPPCSWISPRGRASDQTARATPEAAVTTIPKTICE